MECHIEQAAYDCERQRDHQQESPRCALLILKLTAISDGVTSRQLHIVIHLLLDFRNKTAKITASHIRHDDNAPLSLFAIDLLSSARHIDVRDLTQRHHLSARSMQWDLPHRCKVGAIPIGQVKRYSVTA